MRLPVAAKIALHSAGANGGTPGSPMPLGGQFGAGGMIQTLVTSGASSIRATGIVVEVALLDPAVLEGDLAVLGEAQPHDRRTLHLRAMRSGLTYVPQSTAVSTRGIVSLPFSSTATSTTVAM